MPGTNATCLGGWSLGVEDRHLTRYRNASSSRIGFAWIMSRGIACVIVCQDIYELVYHIKTITNWGLRSIIVLATTRNRNIRPCFRPDSFIFGALLYAISSENSLPVVYGSVTNRIAYYLDSFLFGFVTIQIRFYSDSLLFGFVTIRTPYCSDSLLFVFATIPICYYSDSLLFRFATIPILYFSDLLLLGYVTIRFHY